VTNQWHVWAVLVCYVAPLDCANLRKKNKVHSCVRKKRFWSAPRFIQIDLDVSKSWEKQSGQFFEPPCTYSQQHSVNRKISDQRQSSVDRSLITLINDINAWTPTSQPKHNVKTRQCVAPMAYTICRPPSLEINTRRIINQTVCG